MPKLYAVDLDGTLFYPKHPKSILSKKTIDLIQKIIDSGDIFVTVSGRTLTSCKTVFRKVNKDPYIVSCNGACIYAKDKVIFDRCFDIDSVSKILNYVAKNYKVIGFYVMDKDGKLILKNKLPNILYRIGQKIYDFFHGNLLDKYIISEDAYNKAIKTNQVYKLMIMFGISNKAKIKAKEANKDISQKFGNICSSCWSEQMVEISPVGCDKSSGISELAAYLGINNEDVFVVGDSGNDIPMFKSFYENSYCISKAPTVVKKYAKHTVKYFDDFAKKILGD